MSTTKLVIERTQFIVYDIVIDGKAYVGVTGRTVDTAVRNLLFSKDNRYKIANNSKVRQQLLTANKLETFGLVGFIDHFVSIVGQFDKPTDAQANAIRRQNELSHEFKMVSKHPGQMLGSRVLPSDEKISEYQKELNKYRRKFKSNGRTVYEFTKDHGGIPHGCRIKRKEGI
jgi:hypothetical protein